MPWHRRLAQRLSELSRAEDRRSELRLSDRRFEHLQERRALASDDARTGREPVRSGHPRYRHVPCEPRPMIEMNRMSAMKRFTALLAVVATMFAGPAFANGDVDAGKAKSVTCQACHGADGNAGVDPQYPRLAGQYADYLARALHDSQSGERQ